MITRFEMVRRRRQMHRRIREVLNERRFDADHPPVPAQEAAVESTRTPADRAGAERGDG